MATLLAMAGYSGTPLPKKLGVNAGHRVLLDGAPAAFTLSELPADVTVHRRPSGGGPSGDRLSGGKLSGDRLSGGLYDVIVCFCPDLARLRRRWPVLHRLTPPAGSLWVAWPKRASGLTTDLDEQVVRAYALANGRVDVKVCAIDDTWSGLKHVIRVRER